MTNMGNEKDKSNEQNLGNEITNRKRITKKKSKKNITSSNSKRQTEEGTCKNNKEIKFIFWNMAGVNNKESETWEFIIKRITT